MGTLKWKTLYLCLICLLWTNIESSVPDGLQIVFGLSIFFFDIFRKSLVLNLSYFHLKFEPNSTHYFTAAIVLYFNLLWAICWNFNWSAFWINIGGYGFFKWCVRLDTLVSLSLPKMFLCLGTQIMTMSSWPASESETCLQLITTLEFIIKHISASSAAWSLVYVAAFFLLSKLFIRVLDISMHGPDCTTQSILHPS